MKPKGFCSNRCSKSTSRVFFQPLLLLIFFTATASFPAIGGDGSPGSFLFSPPPAFAEQNWKNEFDEICAKNDDAMSLGVDELKSLIQRCDMLKPRIEALDESTKKVYLRRLQLCRELYFFVLASKESPGPSKSAPDQK